MNLDTQLTVTYVISAKQALSPDAQALEQLRFECACASMRAMAEQKGRALAMPTLRRWTEPLLLSDHTITYIQCQTAGKP